MPKTAVVLLSAGLDSSYNLWRAHKELKIAMALTFDYGQRAAPREISRAARLAERLGVRHHVVAVPWFKDFTKTSLVGDMSVPQGASVSIDDRSRSLETAKAVWVPNRNGILLNIAAGFAEGCGAKLVIPGFNAEEAATFPDNTGEFLTALDKSFSFSTANGVRTHCFSTSMTKTEIVREGMALGLPFADLWPCYLPGEQWCGTCESCQRYARALGTNGLDFMNLRGG